MELINKKGFDKEAIVEVLKSAGRAIWFAVVGAFAAWLTAFMGGGEFNEIIVIVAGFVVKALDRYVHESNNFPDNGLAPTFLQK